MVSELLEHLDTPKRWDGIHPRVLRARWATSNHLPALQANWGCPCSLEVGKCDIHLQEWSERGSRELQACHVPSVPGRHGAGPLECHQQQGQDIQGIRPSQPGFRRGRSCLTRLISSCAKVSCSGLRDRLWMCLPGLYKAFDTSSHSISWRKWLLMDRALCPGAGTG